MSFSFKDKEQLVEDTVNSLLEKMSFEIDLDAGEPLRTIIEAIMHELDLQYWQMEQVYNGSFIESSYGDDLSELIKILGIERKPASYSTGEVKLYRETPATVNYFIPSGTSVETLPDYNGETFKFQTTKDATLLKDTVSVYVPIIAELPGKSSNVIDSTILIVNDPPNGIEFVINEEPTSGGEEEETDEELKQRARGLLDTIGLGTINALYNKVNDIDGILEVAVLDMERGIGTADILVLGDTIPMTSTKREEVESVINKTKAAGIDIEMQEPTLLSIDINADLIIENGHFIDDYVQDVNKAIESYVNTLAIGEKLYKNQLERYILNVSDRILDVNVSSPTGDIIPASKEIIRANNIIIT
jgi:uncharacterized phage protein gp47/JayE